MPAEPIQLYRAYYRVFQLYRAFQLYKVFQLDRVLS
jgi:hypothetical protein